MSTPSFVASVFDLKNLPTDHLAEVAFIGRSNVGKSSLINALAARKALAKTSSTPGKTQSLNYYRFPGDYYIVDTPGYGYARQSKPEKDKWRTIMDSYVGGRESLRLFAVLIDARHEGLANDIAALEWIAGQGRRWAVVLTKSDKVNRRELSSHEKYIREEFSGVDSLFSVSSTNGQGVAALRRYIQSTLTDG